MKAILASVAIVIGCILWSVGASAHSPHAGRGGTIYPHKGHSHAGGSGAWKRSLPPMVAINRYTYVPAYHSRRPARHCRSPRGRYFIPQNAYGYDGGRRPVHIGIRAGF